MATLLTGLVVDSLINNYDKANEAMWRKEDLAHRRQERQWRIDDLQRELEWRLQDIRTERVHKKIANEQRQAETRNEHLSAISEISAELSGFALVSIININLPRDIDLTLLWVYGVASALTICCMVLSLLACTFLMLAVTRYCAHELETDVKQLEDAHIDNSHPFNRWWLAKCEVDWQLAYDLFRAGVTLFLVELAIVAWVQYNHYHITSISITMVAFVGFMIWHSRIWSKWRYLMHRPTVDRILDENTPLMQNRTHDPDRPC
ncbi:hypothetical protein H310_09487 [Aphanomyces invadans]|uniref:Uncharacterized protein n=1 Tax=Aphanomyces invadans TaxID=157072 RepID=A0A024TVD4_9STRA|nr:hypothetical protein H310_09487 [Aphanomyces invadans]ETV97591.1 hypothetical protein H310_09487 [Aphanomyces invadans]|eukprot:XP_008873800.1 hypothetical protein H310_09487 [Aphanomyces invadans]